MKSTILLEFIVYYHNLFPGKEYVVEFDFLGKDSIRYHNIVQIEKRVFKNLQLFMENKKEGDDLFDRLNTSILNEYLSSLMAGLTAKVFRTYNASITLQEQLNKLTDADDNIPAKVKFTFLGDFINKVRSNYVIVNVRNIFLFL